MVSVVVGISTAGDGVGDGTCEESEPPENRITARVTTAATTTPPPIKYGVLINDSDIPLPLDLDDEVPASLFVGAILPRPVGIANC